MKNSLLSKVAGLVLATTAITQCGQPPKLQERADNPSSAQEKMTPESPEVAMQRGKTAEAADSIIKRDEFESFEREHTTPSIEELINRTNCLITEDTYEKRKDTLIIIDCDNIKNDGGRGEYSVKIGRGRIIEINEARHFLEREEDERLAKGNLGLYRFGGEEDDDDMITRRLKEQGRYAKTMTRKYAGKVVSRDVIQQITDDLENFSDTYAQKEKDRKKKLEEVMKTIGGGYDEVGGPNSIKQKGCYVFFSDEVNVTRHMPVEVAQALRKDNFAIQLVIYPIWDEKSGGFVLSLDSVVSAKGFKGHPELYVDTHIKGTKGRTLNRETITDIEKMAAERVPDLMEKITKREKDAIRR